MTFAASRGGATPPSFAAQVRMRRPKQSLRPTLFAPSTLVRGARILLFCMAELRFQTWHVDTRVLFQDLTKDVHQERVFSSAMELAFDIIMDPAQSQTARLRPGQPVTPSMLDLARRKLEDHRNSELRDGLPPWRILSERFSILEPELKAR